MYQESKAAIVGMRSRCLRGILLTAAVFSFFMPKLRASLHLPPSLLVSLSLSLLCASTRLVLSFFLTLTHTIPEAILKSAWRQPPSVGLFLLHKAKGNFFLWLHCPTVGHRDSPPL